ncbi:translation initiation factor IF-2 [bacterium]|nr:translation initiation factor IF-2 [bacterium]
MAGKKIFLLAQELSKNPLELIEIIKEMEQNGSIFSFKISEIKSFTQLDSDDEEKIRKKLNLIQQQQQDDEQKGRTVVTKDGAKIKVRRGKIKDSDLDQDKASEEQTEKDSIETIIEEKKFENSSQIEKIKDITENSTSKNEKSIKSRDNSETIITSEIPKSSDDSEANSVIQESSKIEKTDTEVTISGKQEPKEAKKDTHVEFTKDDLNQSKQDNELNQQKNKKRVISFDEINKDDENKNHSTKDENKQKEHKHFSDKKENFVKKDYQRDNRGDFKKQNQQNQQNQQKDGDKTQSSNKDYEKPQQFTQNEYKNSDDRGQRKKVIQIKELEEQIIMNTPVKKGEKKPVIKSKYQKPVENEDDFSKKRKVVAKNDTKKAIPVKGKMIHSGNLSQLEEDLDSDNYNRKREKKVKKEFKKTEITVPKAIKRVVKISGDSIIVSDFAKEMNTKAAKIIQELFKQGVAVTANQAIDFDTATLIAEEFGYEVKQVAFDVDAVLKTTESEETKQEQLESRAPIVTVMGHVDHGKTKLLDAIRKTNVIDTEAGGITQHIGAYSVETAKGKITFLDTPGHEAFTAMRARGANVTDIVVLVVAADDGIMPQTIEAIKHAQAANVPIIVAINKIDKPTADISSIKEKLTAFNLISEEWGGDTMICKVSAKFNMGIEDLLDTILLQAEMLDLKSTSTGLATGVVIEAFLDKGKGSVTNMLVQTGTIRVGDFIVAGDVYGRVRAMFNDKGENIEYAGPSTPISVLGLSNVPHVGQSIHVTKDEKTAKNVADYYQTKLREEELKKRSLVSAANLFEHLKESEMKELRIILKADVQGSVEAVKAILLRITNSEVRINVLYAGVGAITETDVNLAIASKALIIGFSVRPTVASKEIADKNGVEVRLYSIIYDIEDDVKRLSVGMLDPIRKEVFLGKAEVRQTFVIPKIGTICGSYVTDGKVSRDANVRLIRDHIVIAEDKVKSLKRLKDDAKEVVKGFECGIGLQKTVDIKEGDILEFYVIQQEQRTV